MPLVAASPADTEGARRRWVSAALAAALGAAAILFVAAAAATPVTFHATSPIDDSGFVHLADEIRSGNWLGPFDQYTLIKGPGFPLFLATSLALGLPFQFATALFHLAATALLAWALARVAGSRLLGVAAFLLVLFHPVGTSGALSRVTRDAIYSEELFVALALLLLLIAARSPRSERFLAAAGGLALGWFWLTREEGLWVVPGLALIAGAGWLGRPPTERRRFLAALCIGGVAFLGALGAYRTLNWLSYGRFVGVDFLAPEFRDALSTLESVVEREPTPYVPVSAAKRRALYAVSPTFARLRDTLDPARGPAWQYGCEYFPWTCGDIAGGWFAWALRAAVAQEGEYGSPAASARFFAKLADEVRTACRDGRLTCERPGMAFIPRLTRDQRRTVPYRLAGVVRELAMTTPMDVVAAPSSGTRSDFERMEAILRHPRAMPLDKSAHRFELDARFRGRQWRHLRLRLDCPDRAPRFLPLHRRPASAPASAPGGRGRRFSATFEGLSECGLRLARGHELSPSLPLATLLQGNGSLDLSSGRLELGRARDLGDVRPEDRWTALSRRSRAAIARSYSFGMRYLLIAGLAALAYALARSVRRRQLDFLALFALACWAMIAARTALLTILDAGALPALHTLYLAPIHPLATVASLVSLASFVLLARGAPADASAAAPLTL